MRLWLHLPPSLSSTSAAITMLGSPPAASICWQISSAASANVRDGQRCEADLTRHVITPFELLSGLAEAAVLKERALAFTQCPPDDIALKVV